jgi:hypothetical protein
MIEIIGGCHGCFNVVVSHAFFNACNNRVALGGGGSKRNDVIVVEFEAVAISICKAFDTIQSGNFGACLVAKRISTPVLKAPNAKSEFVFFYRCIKM